VEWVASALRRLQDTVGANKIDNSLPLIGFLIGGGFCCFKIDKGAADITVNDRGKIKWVNKMPGIAVYNPAGHWC
jgi:hypothetical protein